MGLNLVIIIVTVVAVGGGIFAYLMDHGGSNKKANGDTGMKNKENETD